MAICTYGLGKHVHEGVKRRRIASRASLGLMVFLALLLYLGSCSQLHNDLRCGGWWSFGTLVKAEDDEPSPPSEHAPSMENTAPSDADLPEAVPSRSSSLPPLSSLKGHGMKAAAEFLETMKLHESDVEEVAKKAAEAIEEVDRARKRSQRPYKERHTHKHNHRHHYHPGENGADEESQLGKEQFRKTALDALNSDLEWGEASVNSPNHSNAQKSRSHDSASSSSSSSSKLGKVVARACATYTKDYMHRIFHDRIEVERAYLDARALLNELEVNFTANSHPRARGPTKEEVEEARAHADVKLMALHLFDAATWKDYGAKIAPACLDEADNFRYFLLHHSVREQDEAREKAQAEAAQRRSHLVKDEGLTSVSSPGLMVQEDNTSLLEKAQFMLDVTVSTLFPPLYMLQQVVWAVGGYHVSEYRKLIDPWVQKHLPWVLPPASASFHHRHGSHRLRRMPPSSQLLTDSPSIDEEIGEEGSGGQFSVLSAGFFSNLSHSLGGSGSEQLWVSFVVVGVMVVSWAVLPIVLLTFFLRDVLYQIIICQFVLQGLLGFTAPIRVIPILKMLFVNPLAAVQMFEEVFQPFLKQWEERGERWMNMQTLMVVELLVIILPLTIFAFIVTEKWVRLVLAIVW